MIHRPDFAIDLLFPPQGHFTQPYLALPCIQAWLKANGFEDVSLRDLSVEAYDAFLTADYLRYAAERVRERLPLDAYEGRGELGFRSLEAFRAAAESAVSAEGLIERIEDAKDVLRSERFYDRDQYVPAVRRLYHGLRLVSAAHFPSQLTPHNFTMGYSNDSSEEVLAATQDEEQNPFVRFFREHYLPDLLERRPRLVGISVIYGSQLIPALTLGRLIKEALPECHVTAGGGFLAYIGRKVMDAPGMDACLDSLIFYEGEGPMLALAQALERGESLESIGSLAWFDRSEGATRTVHNPTGHPMKLDDAPVPDFDGLPFDKYFSPAVVVPYDINRGCYYGECTFCTLPTVIGPGYRTRKAETIADHVVALRDRYGARNFNFITDCMPPGMIRDLPDELIAKEAGVTWWSDARVEPRAYTREGAQRLYDSGCRKLLFGFETATPRLLKMMKKGQSLKSTVDVARNCSAADISVTFYAMVGFPTETTEEARATLDFLIEHADVVREVSLQTFHIDEVAQTYREPEKFGIRIVQEEKADLALYHDYESEQGMTQGEAAEMFQEMMAGLRANLPIFSGDNIFFFMQKSHYFLHLARGTTPDRFVEDCRERTARREREAAAEPRGALVPRADLRAVRLPFGYKDALAKLASPAARAVRPDFLTGRYVAGALAAAERELGSIPARERALVYDVETAEFTELTPDGWRAVRAWQDAGSLAALEERVAGGRDELRGFARELARVGMVAPRAATVGAS